MKERIAIIDGIRTPMCKAGGVFNDIQADQLGAWIVTELIARSEIDPALMTWILLLLSGTKFLMVVAYFMHLKFDDSRFALLFFAPLGIMVSIAVVLLALFMNLTR